MKKTVPIIAILIITLMLLTGCTSKKENTNNFKIVTSFYPMYEIALNITNGAQNVSIENMADVNVGCLHDYTLKTSDLVKIEDADVFIINGLGIENFTDKILQTNDDIITINASKNITDIIDNNAHVWLDIDKFIAQVEEVANELKVANPENAEVYENNKQEYVNRLNKLKQELPKRKKEKVISFSESLGYLQNTMNLDMLIIETDHEQSSLSAEKLKQVVEYAKTNNITKILIDNNTDAQNANTLAQEVGAKVYVLNSGLNGSSTIEAYETMIKENFEILED